MEDLIRISENLKQFNMIGNTDHDMFQNDLRTFPLGLSTFQLRGHGGRVVTLSPPTSEAGVWFPTRPHVGKLVVAVGQ